MNILFIIGHLNGGGAERIAGELSMCLESDYNVKMVIFEDKGTTYPHCTDMVNIDVPGSDKKSIKKIINLVKRVSKVHQIKKEFKADVAISFQSNANIVNVMSGYCGTICSVRTMLSAICNSTIRRQIEGFILKKADLVVSLSNGVKNDLEQNFEVPSNKIRTIYNFTSQRLTQRNLKVAHYVDNNIIFCTMGRLVEAKGQWHLIKAFSEVVKTLPNSRLRIFGEGYLKDDLQVLTKRLAVSDKVDFCGFREYPWGELTKCNVFIFTSLWEGFGNAIIESMHCGLPVIVVNCNGGVSEIINPCSNKSEGILYGEYGLMVDAFPKEKLDNVIFDLELNETEKMLAKAMIKICDKKTWYYYHEQSLLRAKSFSLKRIKAEWIEAINKAVE